MGAYLPSYLPSATLSLVFCLWGGSGRGLGSWSYTYGSLPPSPPDASGSPEHPCRSSGSSACVQSTPTTLPGKDPLQSQPVARNSSNLDPLRTAKTLISYNTVIKISKIHWSHKILPKGTDFDPIWNLLGSYWGSTASQSTSFCSPRRPQRVSEAQLLHPEARQANLDAPRPSTLSQNQLFGLPKCIQIFRF